MGSCQETTACNVAGITFITWLYSLVLCLSAGKLETLQISGFFTSTDGTVSTPYRTLYMPVGEIPIMYAAYKCLRDQYCLSFDIDEENIRLYDRFVCKGGTHCLMTRCPIKNNMRYNRVVDMCFTASHGSADWFTANTTCHSQGGRLLVLDTEEKFSQFRRDYESVPETAWLGAFLTEERWQWMNGQEIQLFDPHWHKDQPEDLGEECINTGRSRFGLVGLNDYPCSVKQYYLCEF